MHWFGLDCPHCGKTKAYHRIPSNRYAPAAPVAFGGVMLALIFDRSRKPQFRCELCDTVFSSHTIASRFFWLFWALFLLGVALQLAVIIFVLLYNLMEDILHH
jgi:rubredoxin